MSARRILRISASLAFLFSLLELGSCGPQPQDCASPRVFCVGLVTDFGGVDSGIQQEAWLALQDAKASGLADRIDKIETIDTRDRLANIVALASKGYDVIVTVGSSIAAETRDAAQEYPDLGFIGVEQPQTSTLTNLTGLVFHEEQSGFLAGVLAAQLTRTRRVGAVCEARFLNPVRRYCDGFEAGVKYQDPDVTASVVYRTGSTDLIYRDPEWGRAAAVEQVLMGADILFAAGGDTAAAALETAAGQGALIMGTETDSYSRLGRERQKLLTSAISNVRSGVLDLLRLARDGRFPGGQYFGNVGLAPFHDQDASVSEAVRERIQDAEKSLKDGSLQLEIPYDNPSD